MPETSNCNHHIQHLSPHGKSSNHRRRGSLVFCKTLMNDFLATPALAGSEYSLMALTHTLQPRSAAYASHIMESHETGVPFRLSANPRNDGYITNLPNGWRVEVPTYVDRLGLHPTTVGNLPPQRAALNMTNINVQGLAAKAGLEGDTEALVQAQPPRVRQEPRELRAEGLESRCNHADRRGGEVKIPEHVRISTCMPKPPSTNLSYTP